MSTKSCFAIGALLTICASAPAAAQSLAMTYRLEPQSHKAQQAPSSVPRCAGFEWLAAIEACGRDLLARIRPTRVEAAPAQTQLPDLGSPVPERLLRSAGGREASIGSARSADLMFRFGSKYRFKDNEDATWEWYRFTDANYESFVKNHAHKAVAVELLVPFQ